MKKIYVLLVFLAFFQTFVLIAFLPSFWSNDSWSRENKDKVTSKEVLIVSEEDATLWAPQRKEDVIHRPSFKKGKVAEKTEEIRVGLEEIRKEGEEEEEEEEEEAVGEEIVGDEFDGEVVSNDDIEGENEGGDYEEGEEGEDEPEDIDYEDIEMLTIKNFKKVDPCHKASTPDTTSSSDTTTTTTSSNVPNRSLPNKRLVMGTVKGGLLNIYNLFRSTSTDVGYNAFRTSGAVSWQHVSKDLPFLFEENKVNPWPVVHVVRHPLSVVKLFESEYLKRDQAFRYLNYTEEERNELEEDEQEKWRFICNLVPITETQDIAVKALHYWVEWARLINKNFPSAVTFQIEDIQLYSLYNVLMLAGKKFFPPPTPPRAYFPSYQVFLFFLFFSFSFSFSFFSFLFFSFLLFFSSSSFTFLSFFSFLLIS